MDKDKVAAKLAAARTRLILDKPFLGALALRMPLTAADPDWCQTAATDARKIYYNYAYVNQLNLSETQFILAKQALHCALSHFARRGHRAKQRWQLACDYAVNPLLIEEGFSAPPGTLIEDSFANMSAEEIYHCLQNKDTDEPDCADQQAGDSNQHDDGNQTGKHTAQTDHDGHNHDENENNDNDNADGKDSRQPAELSQQALDNLSLQWQQRLAAAAQQAQQAGKLSPGMARLVEFMLQPRLPWRMLLASYMAATARDDYNYARPSSRRGDPSILPSLKSAQIDMVVAIDVSGSISHQEMEEFLSEVNAIKGQLRARISLLACDAELAAGAPWIFESWETFTLPQTFSGGGGTDFRPVFDWAQTLDQAPALLVYCSDCIGRFPDYRPDYPVIWLVKGKASAPFGQRIQLN